MCACVHVCVCVCGWVCVCPVPVPAYVDWVAVACWFVVHLYLPPTCTTSPLQLEQEVQRLKALLESHGLAKDAALAATGALPTPVPSSSIGGTQRRYDEARAGHVMPEV